MTVKKIPINWIAISEDTVTEVGLIVPELLADPAADKSVITVIYLLPTQTTADDVCCQMRGSARNLRVGGEGNGGC